MIKAVVLLENASDVLLKWSQVTSKTKRKLGDDGELTGVVELRKEEGCLYQFPFIPIKSHKDIHYLDNIGLHPREVLIIALRESPFLLSQTGKKARNSITSLSLTDGR